MRINRWVAISVATVAVLALFIDGYSYIFRLYNGIPSGHQLSAKQTPTLDFLGINRQIFVHKGLDLQGGTEVVLEIDARTVARGTTLAQAQDSTVQVMQRRVNGIGVSEAQVQTQGDKRVVIQLPGVDSARALSLVGRTSKLTFRVWKKADAGLIGPDGKIKIPLDASGLPIIDPAFIPVAEGGTCVAPIGGVGCVDPGYLPSEIGIDGNMVTSASVGVDSTTNSPNVEFSLNDQGTTILGTVTQNMPSATPPENRLAIFLDNQPINDANVQQALIQGQVQISGGNIASDANYRRDLAATLSAGRLPGRITVVETNSVGATLGFDSVRRAFEAGALGLIVVVIFMVAYYRLPGVVASLALAFYAAVALALFKLIPVTLTLAGMAGFVLSVGMAVDANVLIFERLREELRNGRSLAAAAEAAEKRAFPAIRDSNISTLITCIVLFFYDRVLPFLPPFTVAKGFALTLGIGVVVSFVSAVVVTQLLLALVIRVKAFRTPFLFAVERMQ